MQRPRLYEKALRLLRLQLEHCNDVEGGLFDLSDQEDSLLKMLLKKFRKGLDSITGQAKADVVEELEEVEEYLHTHYGWNFNESYLRSGILELEDGEKVDMDVGGVDEDSDDTGDYAPVIVELTEAQREMVEHESDKHLPTNGSAGKPLPKSKRKDNGSKSDEEHSDEDDQSLENMDGRF